MNAGLALLFWSLVLFEGKHVLCEFVLPTPTLKRNKGVYGHPGGLLHAGAHAIGSLPAILLLSRSEVLVLVILAAEFVLRYHIDWLRLAIVRRRALTYDDSLYWRLFGANQFLHQTIYAIVLALLVRATGL